MQRFTGRGVALDYDLPKNLQVGHCAAACLTSIGFSLVHGVRFILHRGFFA